MLGAHFFALDFVEETLLFDLETIVELRNKTWLNMAFCLSCYFFYNSIVLGI